MDLHFSLAKISNFYLIHHQCCGEKLQNSRHYFETIFDSDFKDYEDCTYSQAISPTIKSECDNIHFEQNLRKSYIKSNIEKNLISNGMFIKKSKKEYTTNDCKILKLQNMASVTESRFCMVVSYSLHEKHKGQI